ncbi:MAG: hypothetical protein JW953_10035 [Anaerolineae bacterium]|nr:hypothetical protein [Anaerolineae bacterium]
MKKHVTSKSIWLAGIITIWPLLACLIGGSAATAIPPQRSSNYEVQTATPTTDPRLITPTVAEVEALAIVPLEDAPTYTPDPNAPSTLPVFPTNTPASVTTEMTLEITPTIALTPTATAPPPSSPPAVTPDPPLQGGDWDFETDFVPWPNPHGEPCPGAAVAANWTAFVEKGPYGSSCMNENLYQPNVFSGAKSQEITFDFISANSGIFRVIPTKTGHRYSIVAYAKHDRSLSPVEMALGLDLTGGTVWHAETVQWFPWDNGAEDTWVDTEETVAATGEQMTIYIKGFHPLAEQGGKTVIDNVSVTHLGP